MNVDFKAALRDQLTFLCSSCASFDAGNKREAVRIATIVRILLHDSRKSSVSLLTHLGAKESVSLSSSVEGEPHPSAPFMTTMVRTTFRVDAEGKGSTVYGAPLDARYLLPMPVDAWWNQVVYILGQVRCTRKSLVLDAADKDGGAHVDAALAPDYATIATTGERGWWHYKQPNDPDGPSYPVRDIHLFYLRQIGFEVMNSPELLALTV
jgi:hypothetical protein